MITTILISTASWSHLLIENGKTVAFPTVQSDVQRPTEMRTKFRWCSDSSSGLGGKWDGLQEMDDFAPAPSSRSWMVFVDKKGLKTFAFFSEKNTGNGFFCCQNLPNNKKLLFHSFKKSKVGFSTLLKASRKVKHEKERNEHLLQGFLHSSQATAPSGRGQDSYPIEIGHPACLSSLQLTQIEQMLKKQLNLGNGEVLEHRKNAKNRLLRHINLWLWARQPDGEKMTRINDFQGPNCFASAASLFSFVEISKSDKHGLITCSITVIVSCQYATVQRWSDCRHIQLHAKWIQMVSFAVRLLSNWEPDTTSAEHTRKWAPQQRATTGLVDVQGLLWSAFPERNRWNREVKSHERDCAHKDFWFTGVELKNNP